MQPSHESEKPQRYEEREEPRPSKPLWYPDGSRNHDPLKSRRVSAAIVLSIAIHLFLVLTNFLAPMTLEPPDKGRELIEITEVPDPLMKPKAATPAKIREQRMAETEDAANKDEDPNAKFLSDRNQKAEKETRAKQIDDFRRQQGSGSKSLIPPEGFASIPPTGEAVKDKGEKSKAENAIGEGEESKAGESDKKAGVKRDWKTLSLKDLSVGGDGGALAASDDKLDDVATGDRTILSTREFRYFSYYQRIKDLLRQYWKPKVEEKLLNLWSRGKAVGEEELVTKVLVLLDGRGSIQKISRVGSSGINDLDDAAVESFQKAAPFPNPPKGIIDSDGFVRIRWDFILKTEAAPKIQFAAPGAGKGQPF